MNPSGISINAGRPVGCSIRAMQRTTASETKPLSLFHATSALALPAAVTVMLCMCSCKPAATTTPPSDVAGTYRLQSVDGKTLPAGVSHDGHKLEIRSGAFTIQTNGTCSSHMVFVPPSGSEATRDVKATYTLDGTTLRMQWEGAGKTMGSVLGNTFTMTNEGMVLVYQR